MRARWVAVPAALVAPPATNTPTNVLSAATLPRAAGSAGPLVHASPSSMKLCLKHFDSATGAAFAHFFAGAAARTKPGKCTKPVEFNQELPTHLNSTEW